MVILKTCEICGEPVLVKDGIYEMMADCKCIRTERIKARIKKFNNLSINDRNNSTDIFSNVTHTAKEEEEIISKMKTYSERFAKAKEDNVGLLLMGKPGTGKTFLGNCITNEIESKGYSVLSFNLSGYLRKIQESYNGKDVSNEDVLLDAAKNADLLYIDDLGSEKLTEWGKEKVYNLIDTRYRANKPILITTNLDRIGLEQQLSLNGSDKLLDRLIGMTKPFVFNWSSRRRQKKVTDLWS
jgi:DNA replication protein DnaC